MSRDPEAGKAKDPRSLHKYLYAGGDPIDRVDPTGRINLISYTLQLVKQVPGVVLVVALTGGACTLLGLEEAFGASPLPEGPEKTLDDKLCAVFGTAAYILGFFL